MDHKAWNVPFLHTIFNQQIVEHIINTHSVPSAYHLCKNELLDTSHFKKQGSWQLLWNLKAPPKVKNLL